MPSAVVGGNTLYMQEAVRQMGTEGDAFEDQYRKHPSPARFEHVNRYRRSRFGVERDAGRTGLRPLREGGGACVAPIFVRLLQTGRIAPLRH